jgi:hypothetical protein
MARRFPRSIAATTIAKHIANIVTPQTQSTSTSLRVPTAAANSATYAITTNNQRIENRIAAVYQIPPPF